MKFCDRCGSYMRNIKGNLFCRKCGNVIHANDKGLRKLAKSSRSDIISVVADSMSEYSKTSRSCPKCGNKVAFHWFTSVSGEHAGVGRERTVEHFKCSKCSYEWIKAW